MKLTRILFHCTLSSCLIVLSICSLAQNKPDTKKPETDKGAISEEIEVVRPYKPVLADAVKIRRSPDLNTNKPFKPNLSYNISDKKLDLNTDIRQLQAQQLTEVPEAVFKNNYAKVGAGNYNTGLAELYINTGKDPALQAGFFLKHINQKGDLKSQQFSHQQFGAFGRSIQDKITLSGELGYDRSSTNFYGFNSALPSANPDPQKQRYDVINFKGELVKNYREESGGLDYAVKANAYLLKDLYEKRENAFILTGFANKTWNSFNFGVNASVDFTTVTDSLNNGNNNIFRVNPYVRIQGETYKLTIGLNFVKESGDQPRTNLLPAVTAEFPIVPKFATLFAGFTGNVVKTSLLDLSRETPYLDQNILVRNSIEKSVIYGGIKGNAGSGFGYKASVSYKKITDMPLLINSYPKVQKFDVIYDYGDSKVLGFEGEITVNTSKTFTWTGKVTANSYKLATEEEAWFKPDLQLVSDARLFLNKKLTIDGEITLYGNSKAKQYTSTPVFDERTVTIKSFADLSAGAEYQLKNKLGIYLRANNILGTRYQRYLYYPKLGLNVLGGFNYSF